jgi:hypothetical protein
LSRKLIGSPAEVATIGCASITQTAAEKFVALTRRTAAELAEDAGPRDPTLARHIYDLHIIRDHFDVAEVASLAREVVRQDAEVFGNQFPAYREDPAPGGHPKSPTCGRVKILHLMP